MALTDNLTVHFNLADNAASTTVVATVGTNGTLAGGDNTSVLHSAGPNSAIADALNFNGVDDTVDISGNSISFASGTACSFRALCKFDAASGSFLGINGTTNARMGKFDDTTITVVATNYTVGSMGTTNFCDCVVTRNASNAVNVYMNGTVSGSGPQTQAVTLAPTRIALANVGFFDGKICSVSVWSRELSSTEVTQLYNSGNWLAYPWIAVVGRVNSTNFAASSASRY